MTKEQAIIREAIQQIVKQIADNRDSSCAGHGCSVCPNQCKYYLEELSGNHNK